MSETFLKLGIKLPPRKGYEWMAEYPDALPLLDAIRSSFKPASILSEKEADDCARYELRNPHFPRTLLSEASKAIEHAPLSRDVHTLYEERKSAARKRLEVLKDQRSILRDVLDQKKSRTGSPSACTMRKKPLQIKELSSRYRSKMELLRRVESRDIGSVVLDSDLTRYHEAEHRYIERVADYASEAAREYVAASQESTVQMPSRLISVIRSYGKICAQQTTCEVQLARITAFLTSLTINDGSYLEMTTSAMNARLEDLRSRTATALKRKIADVSEDASRDLNGEIQAFLISKYLQKQDAYIGTMQVCINAYMEQRLRIHCFQALTQAISHKRDALLESISKIKACSKQVETCAISESATETLEVRNTRLDSNALLNIIYANQRYAEHITESFEDELESSMFSSTKSDSSSIIQHLKDSIGVKNGLLDLGSPAQFSRLVMDMEEALSSTSPVVDSLFRQYETVRKGTDSSGRAANLSWVKRINDRKSPP